MRRIDLRTKLALLASGLTLVGTALGLTLTYAWLLNARIASLDYEGRLLANVILEAVVLREGGAVRVPRVVESYLTDLTGVSVAHVYLDGELLWEGGVVDAPRPLDSDRLLGGRGAASADEWRVFTARDEEAGVAVQVGQPLQSVRKVLGSYAEIAAAVTVAVVVLSGFLAWLSVGAALRPLRRLSEAAEGFGTAGSVPSLPGGDEPAKLARTFAGLLDRLQAEREREQRFLAYAAHELRTPLTALRSGLEALHAGRVEATPDLLQRLHRESTRLEELAQNLLVLSRASAGDAHRQDVDLEELAEAAYDRFQPLALERALTLRLDARAAPVHADARLLEQALNNLVYNALRATRHGEVTLRSGVARHEAFLEVADTGPGVKLPVREGLGLRVVRNVAQVHGGRFELSDEGGTRARLWLPAGENRASP